jgi:hypothetical protein
MPIWLSFSDNSARRHAAMTMSRVAGSRVAGSRVAGSLVYSAMPELFA